MDLFKTSKRGTYDFRVNEVSPIMIWMSVDWANGEFWCTDQIGHYYVKGTVEETGENHYWFRCDYEESNHSGSIDDTVN